MNHDYRFVPSEPTYSDIEKEKDQLIQCFPAGVTNHYDLVSKNELEYKVKFVRIYKDRCCYCGRHTSIIGIEQFQVDHMVPKEKRQAAVSDAIDINHLYNLALACPACNSEKRCGSIDEQNIKKFDVVKLGKVIARDESTFRLTLAEDFANDPDYCSFFERLHLDSDKRRLDYLLYYCGYHIRHNTTLSEDRRNALRLLWDRIREKRDSFTSNKRVF